MDEILLWPVLRGLPEAGNFTCIVSATYEQMTSKTEQEKRVRVVNEKPVVIWTAEAEAGFGSAYGVSTIKIRECYDENDPALRLFALPHFFQVSTSDHKYVEEGAALDLALVRWDDADEVSVEPGPRHLQFILSPHVAKLPHSWNQTRSVSHHFVLKEESITGSVWGVRFFWWGMMLLVSKVIVWRVVRWLKLALKSVLENFEVTN